MPTRRTLVVGLIGYNFMGRAHSNAWRQAPRFFDLPADLRMKTICGRDARKVRAAATKLGWESAVTDWRQLVDDPEIDIVDICTPNNSHAAIAIAAAEAGKALLCEKPLGINVAECERMLASVKRARVVHMVCHNYRRVPAIALAKEMIERGAIGDRIFHFRARYAQDWIADPDFPLVWRLQSDAAGSGALGDICSHIIDLGRYLVGELREVSATLETFVKHRPVPKRPHLNPLPRGEEDPAIAGPGEGRKVGRDLRARQRVDVDDAVSAIGRFRNGAMASLEATRFAPGRKNSLTFGSMAAMARSRSISNR